ncbi:hypothetical protein ZOSMA_65G00120 [Zostera marina]|uniref:Uncharacterized protein n=1 Tax=Zostera marina TaxID=29655 RepID=A0A0K9NUG5_ZOSMR|nr:hypothetical protein ZOSMA_65G00120 [Zostera marina]
MEEGSPFCHFHPREVIVGVCAICLKDRLLALLSTDHQQKSFRDLIVFPKVFALTTSFLHHRQKKSDEESITNLEESFISMKFEDDGKALWDKSAAVVEHRHGVRWRKRVENLLQSLQWNRYKKTRSCHAAVEVADGATVKTRRGSWIKSLTTKKRRKT